MQMVRGVAKVYPDFHTGVLSTSEALLSRQLSERDKETNLPWAHFLILLQVFFGRLCVFSCSISTVRRTSRRLFRKTM